MNLKLLAIKLRRSECFLLETVLDRIYNDPEIQEELQLENADVQTLRNIYLTIRNTTATTDKT